MEGKSTQQTRCLAPIALTLGVRLSPALDGDSEGLGMSDTLFRLTQILVLIVAVVWIVDLAREWRKRRNQLHSSELADSGRLGAGENGNRK
jgi:hypothetical protein